MSSSLRRVLISMMLAFGATACNWPTIRNCELVAGQDAGNFGLTFSMKLPTECPVPIILKGELKTAGAIILDLGVLDFEYAVTRVDDSRGLFAGQERDDFDVNKDGVGIAVPIAIYTAAQGFTGTIRKNEDLNSTATDKAKFQVFHRGGVPGPFATIAIRYRGSILASKVVGPDLPLAGTTGTWNAQTDGGVTPYTYEWFRNGDLVGTGGSYTANVGSEEFGLRVSVTDQSSGTHTEDFWVHVNGVRASISGPTIVYASENGGTWYASPRGGYAPYTYQWYVVPDDGIRQDVGTGESWAGYPGEGSVMLGVRVRDSQGASFDATIRTTGVGSTTGGCQPVPPEVTCSP